MPGPVLITFPDATAAEANQLAGSLALAARDTDREVSVERLRENPDSQDGGATLAILGSAAMVSLAKGIAVWIARHSGTTIRIQSPDGTQVDVKYATGQDTARIVQAALGRK